MYAVQICMDGLLHELCTWLHLCMLDILRVMAVVLMAVILNVRLHLDGPYPYNC